MRLISFLAVVTMLSIPVVQAQESKTYVGVITDTMCGLDHKSMHVSPDGECVRECVKHGEKYALADGKRIYVLSDQETPAQFAAQRVKVTGAVNAKTNILKVEKIEKAQ
jgi:hypothetical protein